MAPKIDVHVVYCGHYIFKVVADEAWYVTRFGDRVGTYPSLDAAKAAVDAIMGRR